MALRTFFFVGKGGVGKSTVSAVAALNFSAANRDTLLVSMDPAHNQRDLFDRPFSEKPTRVADNLAVKEIDLEFWIKKYLKDAKNHLKRTYSYQSAYNLDNFFNILQFSPGLEEHAMIQAFENVVQTAGDKEVLVVDMPPTALTLRFFSLPFITLAWLKELLQLRKIITEKKEIVSKIKLGKRVIEQDKVKAKLTGLIEVHGRMRDFFLSDDVRVNLVMNNDRLSFSEALRLRDKLAEIDISFNRVVVNKLLDGEDEINRVSGAFDTVKVTGLPMEFGGLVGQEALGKYVRENREKLMHI